MGVSLAISISIAERKGLQGDGAVVPEFTPREFAELHTLAQAHGIGTERLGFPLRAYDTNGDGVIGPTDDQDRNGIVCPRDIQVRGTKNGLPYRQAKVDESSELPSGSSTLLHSNFQLYQFDVPIAGLQPALEGLTILHLSDLHFKREGVDSIVALERALQSVPKVDLLVITGDIVDLTRFDLADRASEILKKYAAKAAASFYVFGNHDLKDSEARPVVYEKLKDCGFIGLVNEHSKLTIDGAPLHLIGLDDVTGGRPVSPVVIDHNPAEPCICLTHNIDAVNGSFFRGIDLILSGHLHSGEVKVGPVCGIDGLIAIGEFEDRNGHRRG